LSIAGPCATPLKCHKNILTSQSFFFESMFEFNDNMGEIVNLDFSHGLLEQMLKFIYTGAAQLDSSELIDLLDLSHQYLLPKLKHSIELVLSQNISIETYYDTYTVAKAFDCIQLKENLVNFGIPNVKELRNKLVLGKLDTADQRVLMQK
jgi:hypothetical protein